MEPHPPIRDAQTTKGEAGRTANPDQHNAGRRGAPRHSQQESLVHTVTKVLVVFAVILSVLLAALTMAYAVNVDRIVGDRMAEMNRRLAAETLAASKVAQAVDEQARLEGLIAELRADNTKLKSQIANLELERQTLLADKTSALNQVQEVMSKIGGLVETNKTQALLIDSYRDEVTRLRENELGYRRREIELTDRLNDLASQNEVLNGSVRALQEQLVEAKRALDAGATGTRTTSGGQPYAPTFPVRAQITQVYEDTATRKPMATINVGSNNNIRENMQLVVVREGQWLANFIVTRVDLGWAQGTLDFQGRGGVQVRPGDTVMNISVAANR